MEFTESIADVDQRIAAARLDGKEAELARLRRKREELEREGREVADTEREKSKREAHIDDVAERRRLKKARADAKKAAHILIKKAKSVDDTLTALDAATREFKLATLDLATTMRRAGLSDNGRITRRAGPAARWAAWNSAPVFSEMAEIPRAPAARREPFSSVIARTVPKIEE
ncbi:MAG: hypothetical protein JKX88_10130 [Marinicaulis sp.]|nr:hypothetical protein [Marinicaulis sp.]